MDRSAVDTVLALVECLSIALGHKGVTDVEDENLGQAVDTWLWQTSETLHMSS